MKNLLKYKAVLASFVMALLVVAMGSTSEAITINRKITDEYNYSVGQETSVSGNSIKINGKKIAKMKKKVKAVKTGYSEQYGSYMKNGYFNESSAYKAGKCKDDGYRYYKGDFYTFRFLKAGTYKISYVSYSNYYGWYNVYKLVLTRSEKVNGEWQYYYKLQQMSYSNENGYQYKDVGTEEYLEKRIDSDTQTSYYKDYTYYEGVKSKKIYADGNYGITPATFKTGADGKKHLYYDAVVVKTTTTEQYKVTNPQYMVKSVQLGKSKYVYNYSSNGYATSDTVTVKKFLTGSSGKVTVSMSSDYALQSIVAVTYDKEGNEVYQLVNNKGKVAYGAYKDQYSDKSETGTGAYMRASMYKPTEIYVYYKDKSDGDYTKIKSITKDEDGYYVVTYERGWDDGSKQEYTRSYLPSSNCRTFRFYKK